MRRWSSIRRLKARSRTAASIRKKSSSRSSEAFGAVLDRRLSLINVTDADLREQLERLAACAANVSDCFRNSAI